MPAMLEDCETLTKMLPWEMKKPCLYFPCDVLSQHENYHIETEFKLYEANTLARFSLSSLFYSLSFHQ